MVEEIWNRVLDRKKKKTEKNDQWTKPVTRASIVSTLYNTQNNGTIDSHNTIRNYLYNLDYTTVKHNPISRNSKTLKQQEQNLSMEDKMPQSSVNM